MSTQTRYLIALRVFLAYFHEKNIPTLPTEKIKLPKDKKEKLVQFLELEQVQQLLNNPDTKNISGLRDRAILETLFSTGLRVAELVSLDRKYLEGAKNKSDFEMGIIGKGSYPRTIYFSERALEWIKRYLNSRKDESEALFVREKKGKSGESGRLSVR